jgi:hypothetical protein
MRILRSGKVMLHDGELSCKAQRDMKEPSHGMQFMMHLFSYGGMNLAPALLLMPQTDMKSCFRKPHPSQIPAHNDAGSGAESPNFP